jgi:dTDP-4-dehydrorhamnose reductase
MWGGVECTINRVGDTYADQVARSGHDRRLGDFERFMALGIRTLRHGVLWERVVRQGWGWADASMAELARLEIRPIVGLVHHGSGPAHTSLLDLAFPGGLARHAAQVAQRYPWVLDYTPVNEPLTTARFSGLYGHWYPHRRDDHSFARALLTQLKATVLAMRAIRREQPAARLIQTEDIGRTWSTPGIAYQARFDDQRRWLTYDLLTGRVDRQHPMVSYLRSVGLSEAEIFWFAENPCPPAVLGINYYLTSDRFLDDRLDLYPPGMVGGNGRHRYVDVEAVRVRPEGIFGAAGLLEQAWRRYGIPPAITEVHNGSDTEQQVLWFEEVWGQACQMARRGVPVAAVTPWALLGSYDWCSLVTRQEGKYEPGVFSLDAEGVPQPTLLSEAVRSSVTGSALPVVLARPWWREPERVLYAPAPESAVA